MHACSAWLPIGFVPFSADTHLLKQIDAGELPEWAEKPAPVIARNYWKLPPEATLRDVRAPALLVQPMFGVCSLAMECCWQRLHCAAAVCLCICVLCFVGMACPSAWTRRIGQGFEYGIFLVCALPSACEHCRWSLESSDRSHMLWNWISVLERACTPSGSRKQETDSL